jgi:hypothetical protein
MWARRPGTGRDRAGQAVTLFAQVTPMIAAFAQADGRAGQLVRKKAAPHL